MQLFTTAVLVSFALLSNAQLINLPSCAKGCANNALPSQCNLDVGCICSDSSFISSISCCVKQNCDESDQQQTIQSAAQLCKTAGVTIPSEASCDSSSSGAASSGAAGGSSMAGSMGSSATGSMMSAATMMSASGMSASGASTMVSAAGGSSAGSATATASVVAHTGGAAVQELGSKMGAVGAAVAALVLL